MQIQMDREKYKKGSYVKRTDVDIDVNFRVERCYVAWEYAKLEMACTTMDGSQKGNVVSWHLQSVSGFGTLEFPVRQISDLEYQCDRMIHAMNYHADIVLQNTKMLMQLKIALAEYAENAVAKDQLIAAKRKEEFTNLYGDIEENKS